MPRAQPAETYEKLFSNDPLLLDEKSQNEYGRAILRHLLIDRTLNIIDPDFIDIHQPEGRGRLERKDRTDLANPSDVHKQEYTESRILRRAIKSDAKKSLEKISMICDGRHTARRMTKLPNHSVAAKTKKEAWARRLRIATVGYRVKISKGADVGHLEEDLCVAPKVPARRISDLPEMEAGVEQLGRTKFRVGPHSAAWATTISTYIECALKQKSQVVILPEFALPPTDDGLADRIDKSIAKACAQATHDHFLFAGTRHEGGYNRGLICSRRKDQTETLWHYKIASARSLHENILGPYNNKILGYKAEFRMPDRVRRYQIGIAICYDIYDPTTFLSFVLAQTKGRSEYRSNILLVPSFNPSSDFVALLRDVSFLTGSIVVYVNGLHGDAKMFISGFAIADLAGKYKEVRGAVTEKIKTLQDVADAEQDNFDQEASRSRIERTPVLEAQVGIRHRKIEALIGLRDALDELNNDGALRNMITVEDCQKCNDKSHDVDNYCEKDILYYNIDPRLFGSLQNFREKYLEDDNFLPEPFRANELKIAREAMTERIRTSEQQNAV